MHTDQEIELLEDISQQLKNILAKFHKMHLKKRQKSSKTDCKRKNPETSPEVDFSDRNMSKMRFER